VRVAFDSRAATAERDEAGHYSRCLLAALRETAGEHDEILESHRPRGADVFHAPWIEGAMLRSPCPTIVTVHDVGALTRRSERLRCGGVHLRLRHLALQRATHVIVPGEAIAEQAVAELGLERERVIVIPRAPAHADWSWQDAARATWRAYAAALAQPERPCVGGLSRRRGARAPQESSSAGPSDPAPATSARGKGSRDAPGRRSRARSDPRPATGP
jgi:Glycosyltransferase Family 4